jgi:hypothetical protein
MKVRPVVYETYYNSSRHNHIAHGSLTNSVPPPILPQIPPILLLLLWLLAIRPVLLLRRLLILLLLRLLVLTWRWRWRRGEAMGITRRPRRVRLKPL